jgi:hypothetical protein
MCAHLYRKENTMSLERTLELAKRGALSRSEIYAKVCTIAEERREPGTSEHQAFAKFISGEGRELYQVMSSLPGRDIEAAWQPPAPIAKSAGSGEWHDLVAFLKLAHKRSHPHDSDAKANAAAVNAAMSTPEGVFLFKQQRRAEQVASGVFSAADLAMLDAAEAELQQHVDLHKRAGKSEFERMVDDVKRAKPHLTDTAAGDFVRSKPDGMAAWQLHKGKPGQNGVKPGHSADDGSRVPFVPETSGRTDPPRTPQWQSDHSGSTPTTPARTPERFSETPAIKQWLSMVKRLQFDCGFTHERASEILKLTADGRKVYEQILAEAR